MTLTGVTPEHADAPIWDRPDVFPPTPHGGGWGWMNLRGQTFPCASLSELEECIRRGARIALVWTPDAPHLVVPEEVPALFDALHDARMHWAADDISIGKQRMIYFTGLTAVMALWAAWAGMQYANHLAGGIAQLPDQLLFAFETVRHSAATGIALLLLLIFGFIPWYRGRKRQQRWRNESQADLDAMVAPLRFETWLDLQRAPVTLWFAILMALVGLAQVFSKDSADHAALVLGKMPSEPWRYFTAPFMHGHWLHWFMNVSALLYLGRRMEVLARWPHLPLVFALAALLGGECTVRFSLHAMHVDKALGASGGLMGWLGFLLVFETLHPKLAPLTVRRRLLGGLALTALIGLLGYKLIDNAAHAGGLVAGMLYALVVFPKSSSPHRPRGHWADFAAGSLALAACSAAAAFAIWKIV